MKYTVFSDDASQHYKYKIYDDNGNLLTCWAQCYSKPFDNIYKDEMCNLIVPAGNELIMLDIDDYYKDNNCADDGIQLHVFSFSELDSLTKSIWCKFTPNIIYNVPLYSVVVLDNQAFVTDQIMGDIAANDLKMEIAEKHGVSKNGWFIFDITNSSMKKLHSMNPFLINILSHLNLNMTESIHKLTYTH